jgi:hypothetical protein
MKDEFAGRTAQCPSCRTMFRIPFVAKPEPVAEEYRPSRPVSTQRDAERPAEEPESDWEDEVEDEDTWVERRLARQRARKRHAKRLRRTCSLDQSQGVCLGVGLFVLVFLGLTPMLPWAYISASSKVTVAGQTQKKSFSGSVTGMGKLSGSEAPVKFEPKGTTEGWTILFLSIAAATLVGLALVVHGIQQFQRDWSAEVLTGATALACAWGMTASFWMLGNIWRVVTMWIHASSKIREAKERMAGMASSAVVPDLDISITVLPHFGLWLGLLAGVAVVVLFSLLANQRDRSNWALIANAIGAAAGLLIVLFYIQPWSAEKLWMRM